MRAKLNLVPKLIQEHMPKPKQQGRPRPIVASCTSKSGTVIYTRNYCTIDSALQRAIHELITAAPGTVVELSHAVTGLQLGWAKVRVGCKIECHWVWD